jgi:hypothetical protein
MWNWGKYHEKIVAKFTAGVVDTGVAPWLANISVNFRKKS